MKKQILFIALVLGSLILAGCSSDTTKITGKAISKFGDSRVTMYKSSSCGCCAGYLKYLEKQSDFDIDVVEKQDIGYIKDEFGIPSDMRSCHTIAIGDYFIEGHVPLEAVEKLMNEQPDIAGIALPRMPSGTPGMPGTKTGTWVVMAVNNDGSVEEFMRV